MTLDDLMVHYTKARNDFVLWANNNNVDSILTDALRTMIPDSLVKDVEYGLDKREQDYWAEPFKVAFYSRLDAWYTVAKTYCIARDAGIPAATLYKLSLDSRVSLRETATKVI